MNNAWSNCRDLWNESIWFRVSLVILATGTALLLSSWGGSQAAQGGAAATARDLASDLRQALEDDDLQLNPGQEQLAREAIGSLTPAQRKRYEALTKKLGQLSTNSP
jgi:hypothetical protein